MNEPSATNHPSPSPGERAFVRNVRIQMEDAERRSPPAPRHIAHYRILGVLGRGGMGVVYRAEQPCPKRVVALKVMRPGRISSSRVRRFRHESELLGRLEHPGIARIYEAGLADTDQGLQPFLAMELVSNAMPVTRYARQHELGLRDRLELLARICDAVHHAHQHAIIHRDLKPANIVVDDTDQVKVLDFGAAIATEGDLKLTTIEASLGRLVGTLPYMSPEQTRGLAREIDTRSDIYSLGVVGYELLVGSLPYDLRDKEIPEVVRIICEEEPSYLGDVDRSLSGDVETIINKTLQKDKSQRYGSASELAADLRRFLNQEPIAARPPSVWYVGRRFVSRHRMLVGGVWAAVLALVLGSVAVEQAHRAREKERTAVRVRTFLNHLFRAGHPSRAGGHDVALLDAVREVAPSIEALFEDDLRVQSNIHEAIGQLFYVYGHYDEAEAHLRNAVLLTAHFGRERPDFGLGRRVQLADLLRDNGRLDEAEPVAREGIELARASRLRKLQLLLEYKLAEVIHDQGDLLDAERRYRDIFRRQADIEDSREYDMLDTMASIGIVLVHQQGDLDEAVELLTRAIETRQDQNPNDEMGCVRARVYLAQARLARSEIDAATADLRDLVGVCHREMGPAHPDTLRVLATLGRSLMARGDLAEAGRVLTKATQSDDVEKTLHVHHWRRWVYQSDLGHCLALQDRANDGEPLLDEAVRQLRRILPEPGRHWRVGTVLLRHGQCLVALGRLDEAETTLRTARDTLSRTLGPDDRRTIEAQRSLMAMHK